MVGAAWQYSNGQLYTQSGVVYDPVAKTMAGTLAYGTSLGAIWAVGPVTVNPSRGRAYAAVCIVYPVNSACGNYLNSFDLQTYNAVTIGSIFGAAGLSSRVVQVNATVFAVLDNAGQVDLVSHAAYSQ
jgi:hypothetical protein